MVNGINNSPIMKLGRFFNSENSLGEKIKEKLSPYIDAGKKLLGYNAQEDAYLDFDPVEIGKDLIEGGDKIFNKKGVDNTLGKVANYAEFYFSEKYRNQIVKEDAMMEKDPNCVKNCFYICDKMFLGDSINEKSEAYGDHSGLKMVEEKKDSKSGFHGEVYKDEDNKRLIISYQCTNNVEDWTSDDLDMALGDLPDQYKHAQKFYDKYANNPKYKDYEIVVTGYSLGGSLAQLVGSSDKDAKNAERTKTITFNAFGAKNIMENWNDNIEDGEAGFTFNNEIYNYITDGDFVSCSSEQVGKTVLAESTTSEIPTKNRLLSAIGAGDITTNVIAPGVGAHATVSGLNQYLKAFGKNQ